MRILPTLLVVLGAAVAGCRAPKENRPEERRRGVSEAASEGDVSVSFEDWYRRARVDALGLAAAATPYLGKRVRWTLHAMGREVNGAYDPAVPNGPSNWRERARLFTSGLSPRSDLSAVLGSRVPVIVAVLADGGEGYGLLDRTATVRVAATLWGVDGNELFLKDYRIEALPFTSGAVATAPVADPEAQPVTREYANEMAIVERLVRHPLARGRGEVILIGPTAPGKTSDGHTVAWLDPSSGKTFPGVKIEGPQPSVITARNVAWSGSLWFDNGHCWRGADLVRTPDGDYASLLWRNLGRDAVSSACTENSFEN